MKNNNSKFYKLMLSLLLITPILLVGCNRSATEGIIPDDFNEEEVVSNETNDLDENTSESDLGMQALLDEEIDVVTNTEEQVDHIVETTTDQSNIDDEMTSETLVGVTPNEVEGTTTDVVIVENIPASSVATYTVQSGDWVYKIARLYNITPMDLLTANPVIGADQQVYPGQELIIPTQGNTSDISSEEQALVNNVIENSNTEDSNATLIMAPANAIVSDTYEVKVGETMFSISQKLGVSIDSLAVSNNISEPFMIFVGQQLIIPSE